ncbi:MAG: type II and III secretion system protein [Lewinella sp.]|nr:type II and III secretion system protein [Lewinella sp.]
MKPTHLLLGLILLIGLVKPGDAAAQQIVQEYKIRNLLSDVVIEKFQQINQSVEVYEHREGNRLILVGDSLDIELAIEQLELLDVKQMMVTIEFMLVEYFHENNFEWGIDITSGTSGNFGEVNYTPGFQGGTLSFLYNSVTKLTPTFLLNLRALVNNDRAKVLTNPHLVVQSGVEASLNIQDRRTLVLETATINGVTTTLQTIEAGISLNITPVPTHDSLIHLNINGVISEFLPFSNSGEFIVEENRIMTEVDVLDGNTLILGGLILEETNTVEGGIPLLKDIPLLGNLFKNRREIKNYVERVMYITPYLHPIEDIGRYEELRRMTPLEMEIQDIIERDPDFLQYENSQGSMERNRRAARRAGRNN